LVEIASDNMEGLRQVISKYDKVDESSEEGGKLIVKLTGETTSQDLNRFLFEKGIILSHLAQKRKTLEKYFLELLNKS
jgi:ABC-2 type transport system ATP-binding protein